MSRFSWIFISYTLYVSVLVTSNTVSFVMDKPVQALGFLTRWWVIALVFLVTYISEWGSILLEKRE